MTNWKTILETDNFIIDYDKTNAKYRVSYFEDNHFVDDVVFDAYEPVVHGEWSIVWVDQGHIDMEKMYKCSVCGGRKYNDYRHCPECGAKMDGVRKK